MVEMRNDFQLQPLSWIIRFVQRQSPYQESTQAGPAEKARQGTDPSANSGHELARQASGMAGGSSFNHQKRKSSSGELQTYERP